MNKKLKCVLLIDDDEPTNYLNKLIIEETGYAEHIAIAQSAKEAIQLLNEGKAKVPDCEAPDLIFLDINMPAINGWEFLDLYKKVNTSAKKDPVLIMLTTSLHPDDEQKSKSIPAINGFERKPLSSQMMKQIMEKYF